MIQQINLYQEILKQQQDKPGINRSGLALIAAMVLLLVFSLYLLFDLYATKNSLQQARRQLSEAETRVQLLKIQFPEQQINKLLSQEISRSQNTLNNLSKVIYLLTDKKSDQTQGFSRYFSALSRQSIADVWLSNIYINGKKHTLKLQGSTFNPEKVPVFIQKLHNEPVFQGRNFAELSMTQAEKTENQIDFSVSTMTEILENNTHD